jgi:hypothetical protein
MAKNYAAVSAQYQAQHGLLKCFIRDPATGQPKMSLKTQKEVDALMKRGLFVYTPKAA